MIRSSAFAKRPGLYRAVKKPVTLRLDQDVVEWFKGHAPEGGYKTELGRVLRRNVAGAGGGDWRTLNSQANPIPL